ncbi:hypothetical protein FHQ18_06980 [Deferribacter autotrophicus]|uniref:Calcium/calmodulin-dependent protein kinase II association-domain domain-containing protein n=1 Tax=Deferribacter autotrophicus TaxID=500465 RepID=A0A5A8F477_9BACT|nr:hypothetical protein FHQ18_06980 [Deferribacter autotrophicus]
MYLTNNHAQIYENTAILLSYTLILSTTKIETNYKVVNETRVIVKFNGELKVVHIHKSPGK